MKIIATIVLIFLSIPAYLQESEQFVESKISAVTVYLSGAQISRNFNATLAMGNTTIVIGNLPVSIQQRSLQVKADHAGVKVLSVSSRLNYMEEKERNAEVVRLESLQQKLAEEMADLEVWVSTLDEEESLLLTNKNLGGGEEGVQVEELKLAAMYYRERLVEIKSKRLTYIRKIDALKEQTKKVQFQLGEWSNKKPEPVQEVMIKVEAGVRLQSGFVLSYMVNDASWMPSYDIRAENIQRPIEVTYKANVHQNTGEDWDKVKLTFSNADPSQSSVAPNLNTWYLGFNNRMAYQDYDYENKIGSYAISSNAITGRVISEEDGAALPGVNVIIKGTTVGTVTDLEGNYHLPLTADARQIVFSFVGLETQEIAIGQHSVIDVELRSDVAQLSEVVVTGLSGRIAGVSTRGYSNYTPKVKKEIAATPVVNQTTLEFTVAEPYTVKSDGRNQTVAMVAYELPATYQYYAAPKLDTDAFLKAQVTDWDEYNFLAGEASLFFEGKFIGKTVLDTRNVEDTLNISLGRDKNIVITREKVKDLSANQFIGSNVKALVAFDIQVRNRKQQPALRNTQLTCSYHA